MGSPWSLLVLDLSLYFAYLRKPLGQRPAIEQKADWLNKTNIKWLIPVLAFDWSVTAAPNDSVVRQVNLASNLWKTTIATVASGQKKLMSRPVW